MDDYIARQPILLEQERLVLVLLRVPACRGALLHLALEVQAQVQVAQLFVLFNGRDDLSYIATILGGYHLLFGLRRLVRGLQRLLVVAEGERLIREIVIVDHRIILFVISKLTVDEQLISFFDLLVELDRIVQIEIVYQLPGHYRFIHIIR